MSPEHESTPNTVHPPRENLASIRALICLALICGGIHGRRLEAQDATDRQGLIRSDRWLALGPFRQDSGCGSFVGELLANYIAPSKIGCEYPSEGDAVDFDPAAAASQEYVGPTADDGSPLWRPFRDGENDALIDLRMDESFPCDRGMDFTCRNLVTFLATYVELTSDSPADIELCLGIDDGAQVWWDGQLVFNRPGCIRAVACENRVPLTVEPGVHRVVIASFDGGGGSVSRFGLLENGLAIRDGDPDWVFHGERRPGQDFPDCEIRLPLHDLRCDVSPDGTLELFWSNPPADVRGDEIDVILDGQLLETLFSDESDTVVVPEDFRETGTHEVCVVNESGIPDCCTFEVPPPFRLLRCRSAQDGGLSLEWQQVFRPPVDRQIEVRVDGEAVATIPATRTEVTLGPALLPDGFTSVCLVDHRGIEVCCEPQVTDPATGLIRTRNWLVLGPFGQDMECNGRDLDDRLLLNYTFPTEIRCQYPEVDSAVSYDAFQSASNGYLGPRQGDSRPFWRLLEDGSAGDGDLDLRREPGAAGLNGSALSFLASYVELRGAPVEVSFCFGADDAAQLWLDDRLVFNKYECGTRDICEHSASAIVTPGAHRIMLGIFQADGDWGASLAIRVGGEAVLDDPVLWPQWTFHGVHRPDDDFPCTLGEICTGGRDDDGDTLIDCEDPDCRGSVDCPLGPVFRRGDVNGDQRLDVTDPILNLTFQFVGEFDPDCLDALDFDDSGVIDVSDPIANLTRQFLGGEPAPAPGSVDCGPDPTDDELGCTTPASCG